MVLHTYLLMSFLLLAPSHVVWRTKTMAHLLQEQEPTQNEERYVYSFIKVLCACSFFLLYVPSKLYVKQRTFILQYIHIFLFFVYDSAYQSKKNENVFCVDFL